MLKRDTASADLAAAEQPAVLSEHTGAHPLEWAVVEVQGRHCLRKTTVHPLREAVPAPTMGFVRFVIESLELEQLYLLFCYRALSTDDQQVLRA